MMLPTIAYATVWQNAWNVSGGLANCMAALRVP
jgi:hypothetical protein